jgi:hypothetical protein
MALGAPLDPLARVAALVSAWRGARRRASRR